MKAENLLSGKEPKSLLKTLIALILIGLCLVAANWQYHRGVKRHANNFQISANTSLPVISLNRISDYPKNQWRSVSVTGTFNSSHNVLLRNRYNADGKYGYEFLTLFSIEGKNFWVDRGWVAAGNNAEDRPTVPDTPTGELSIVGRLRLGSNLPRGSFFALPATGNLISQWNLKSKVETEDFYLDLLQGDGVTPANPVELPELSDGPHMAYALQWIFFALLIGYGRYLIRKR